MAISRASAVDVFRVSCKGVSAKVCECYVWHVLEGAKERQGAHIMIRTRYKVPDNNHFHRRQIEMARRYRIPDIFKINGIWRARGGSSVGMPKHTVRSSGRGKTRTWPI